MYTNCACAIVLGILFAQARTTMPCIHLVLYCMFAMPNRVIYSIYASAVRVQRPALYLSASYLPCLCTAVSAARRTLSCFVCAVGCFSYLAMVSEFFWKYSEYPCSLQAPKQLSIKAFARVPGYQAVQIQSIEALTVTYILWI